MKYISRALAALLVVLWLAPTHALAQAAVTLRDAATNKAAGVVTLPLFVQMANGSGAISLTNPLPITGNVGGYDSGTTPVQSATPANSSHTAGQSVGGLFSVPIQRTTTTGAQLENVNITSVGGDAQSLLVYVWDRKPTNSNFACTDNTAFALGSGSTGGTVANDAGHLITPPFTITLGAAAQTTGDALTYGWNQFTPPISVKNQDSVLTQNVFICLKAEATFTPAAQPYLVDAMGPQD